jgi:hypothetical protein
MELYKLSLGLIKNIKYNEEEILKIRSKILQKQLLKSKLKLLNNVGSNNNG